MHAVREARAEHTGQIGVEHLGLAIVSSDRWRRAAYCRAGSRRAARRDPSPLPAGQLRLGRRRSAASCAIRTATWWSSARPSARSARRGYPGRCAGHRSAARRRNRAARLAPGGDILHTLAQGNRQGIRAGEAGLMGWAESGQAGGERAADWAYLIEPYARRANDALFDRAG